MANIDALYSVLNNYVQLRRFQKMADNLSIKAIVEYQKINGNCSNNTKPDSNNVYYDHNKIIFSFYIGCDTKMIQCTIFYTHTRSYR